MSVYGTPAQIKAAFNTDLGQTDATHYANQSAVQVPRALADIVLAVQGLQNVATMHTRGQTTAASTSRVRAHPPTDFATIYGASSLPPASNITIGIIASGDLTQTLADLSTFTNQAGFAAVNTSAVNAGTPTGGTDGIE